MIRRIILAVVGVVAVGGLGCCTQNCCEGPLIRQDELLKQSKDTGKPRGVDWRGEEVLPDHTTPVRIHGSIM